MNREMLAIWTLIVVVVCFIVWLAWTEPAGAALRGEGTSDGTDPGYDIQMYKMPGTTFNGRFARAREHYNRIPGVPDFVMVRDLSLAEVRVWKGSRLDCWQGLVCDGHMLKHPDPAIDEIMVLAGMTPERTESVIEHELGHVLDLDHVPCDDYSSIMNECSNVSRITFYDRITLKTSPYY